MSVVDMLKLKILLKSPVTTAANSSARFLDFDRKRHIKLQTVNERNVFKFGKKK